MRLALVGGCGSGSFGAGGVFKPQPPTPLCITSATRELRALFFVEPLLLLDFTLDILFFFAPLKEKELY